MKWIQVIRPKTLPASLCPVFMGSVMAFTSGTFSLLIFVMTLLTALGIQILCNLVNDYADFLKGADTTERIGPVRATASGLINIDTMKKTSLAVMCSAVLTGSFLIYQGGVLIGCLLACSLVLAYAYTTGPFPLAYLGLGECFVFPFFGPIAVAMTYYLQTGSTEVEHWVAGCALGALSTAILIANNLRDEAEDRRHNKKTLVVRYGSRFGKGEYLLCIALAILSPLYFIASHPFVLMAMLIFLPAGLMAPILFKPNDYRSLLPRTARLLLLYTLLFCIGWML